MNGTYNDRSSEQRSIPGPFGGKTRRVTISAQSGLRRMAIWCVAEWRFGSMTTVGTRSLESAPGDTITDTTAIRVSTLH